MDEDGLVTIDRDPGRWSTGNGLLYTGIFYTLLFLRGEALPEDVVRFSKTVYNCWQVPGVLNRNPGRPDLESHDDYIGVMAASYHLNTPHAKIICGYGEKHWWSFNNVDPCKWALQTYHGRFPGLVGYYRMAARKPPGMLQSLMLNAKITASACPSENASGKILTWLMTTVLEAENKPYFGDSIELWKARMKHDYKTLNGLFSTYFKPSHPFSQVLV